MRDLADASVEGLLVCDGETIVSVNTSFAALTGLHGFRSGRQPARKLLSRQGVAHQTAVRLGPSRSKPSCVIATARMTPVELILRPIVFAGRPHHVVAVRDLQARKEAEQHIHFLAHHDALTSLPNRSHFNGRVDQEIAALTPKARASRCFASISTDSRRSTTCSVTPRATRCFSSIASRITAVLDERQMWRGLAATSSPF